MNIKKLVRVFMTSNLHAVYPFAIVDEVSLLEHSVSDPSKTDTAIIKRMGCHERAAQ
jgi:hypothetical protein